MTLRLQLQARATKMMDPSNTTTLTEELDEFQGLLDCVPEVLEMLEEHKGLKYMEQFSSIAREIQLLQRSAVETAKDALEALKETEETVSAESKAVEEKLAAVKKQEQELKTQLSTLDRNNKEQEEECNKLKERMKALKKEKEDVLKEKERVENETTILVPKKREEINLYGNISKIRWDTDSSRVKGYVSKKTEVKPFDFDPNKCSKFFIVNSLWDLIPEDW